MVIKLGTKQAQGGPPRPSGPFAALAGPSRKAAWRRTLVRRLAAGLLVGLAVVLLLARPGPLGSLAGEPAPKKPSADAGLFGGDAGGGDSSADEGSGAGDGSGAAAGGGAADPSALGPAGSAGALGVVRIGGLRGAGSVPSDAVGISLPALDDSMAARLRPGDIVDVYATGRKSPVARAARVIEAIALRDTRSGVSEESGSAAGPAAGGARVFVAMPSGDVARVVSAGQRGDTGVTGFWFAVRAARSEAAAAP